jgi:hypothetical protein
VAEIHQQSHLLGAQIQQVLVAVMGDLHAIRYRSCITCLVHPFPRRRW